MLQIMDYIGVVVFAMTGCLVAARRHVDIIGFIWLATVTAVGGGTVRDLILNRPVFWVENPFYLTLCFITALVMYLSAHYVHRHVRWVLWGDALGLAVFAVIGTQVAAAQNESILVAMLMGVLTATLGGVLRDLLAGEPTLVLRKEIYVTAAALSSGVYLILFFIGVGQAAAIPLAVLSGFMLRAAALRYRLRLPAYRPHGYKGA
jgi:uncharacterized membrane protein YeiH